MHGTVLPTRGDSACRCCNARLIEPPGQPSAAQQVTATTPRPMRVLRVGGNPHTAVPTKSLRARQVTIAVRVPAPEVVSCLRRSGDRGETAQCAYEGGDGTRRPRAPHHREGHQTGADAGDTTANSAWFRGTPSAYMAASPTVVMRLLHVAKHRASLAHRWLPDRASYVPLRHSRSGRIRQVCNRATRATDDSYHIVLENLQVDTTQHHMLAKSLVQILEPDLRPCSPQ